jgi:hypothetical protein
MEARQGRRWSARATSAPASGRRAPDSASTLYAVLVQSPSTAASSAINSTNFCSLWKFA